MKEKMITPDAIISEMEKLRESGQETELLLSDKTF